MLEKFIPDSYQKSIYAIDYKKLKSSGIKCILFDLDNTLVPYQTKKPTKKIKDLVENLKDMGFKIILFSNATKKRLTPFKEILEVDCSAFSMKPSSKKFKKVFKQYKFTQNEIVLIGDQMLTDVYGGNKVGITTILVNPVTKRDYATVLNRLIEGIIMRKAAKKKLFCKGQYYD
ncbi:MAG: YqeG family HAD IIIA-type phosphatase [Bacilli bacterium]|nr:YqeG family HAD IIIA-type phosphatase [Bacilli bacterium]